MKSSCPWISCSALSTSFPRPEFRKQIALAESTGGWPTYVIGNHDMARSFVRYGDGKHNDQIAKLMAGLYLTLRGTPIMYYGEEIGMENNDPTRKEDVKDPMGITGWPGYKGRDGERTPMQWDDSANAGFTTGSDTLAAGSPECEDAQCCERIERPELHPAVLPAVAGITSSRITPFSTEITSR